MENMLSFWRKCLIHGEPAQFMVNMLNKVSEKMQNNFAHSKVGSVGTQEMTVFGIFEIGPLEPCRNEFQSTGSHRLTVCTGTDSCYYISAYTWGQKRNTFPQGSSGSIFKIPKNVISYEPTEPTFE